MIVIIAGTGRRALICPCIGVMTNSWMTICISSGVMRVVVMIIFVALLLWMRMHLLTAWAWHSCAAMGNL